MDVCARPTKYVSNSWKCFISSCSKCGQDFGMQIKPMNFISNDACRQKKL